MLYTSEGILNYSSDNGYRLVVTVDPELAAFYRSLIPKYIAVNRPKFEPHITVVRAEKEIPINLAAWNKYQNELIKFEYDSELKSGTIYFWLNVWCVRLEEIRRELGLPVISEFTLPPEGYIKCFHTTVANRKVNA